MARTQCHTPLLYTCLAWRNYWAIRSLYYRSADWTSIMGCLATQLLYTTFLSASIMPGPDQAWLLFHRPHKTFIKLRDFSPRLVGPRGSHQTVHTRCSFQNQPQLCRNKRQWLWRLWTMEYLETNRRADTWELVPWTWGELQSQLELEVSPGHWRLWLIFVDQAQEHDGLPIKSDRTEKTWKCKKLNRWPNVYLAKKLFLGENNEEGKIASGLDLSQLLCFVLYSAPRTGIIAFSYNKIQ